MNFKFLLIKSVQDPLTVLKATSAKPITKVNIININRYLYYFLYLKFPEVGDKLGFRFSEPLRKSFCGQVKFLL